MKFVPHCDESEAEGDPSMVVKARTVIGARLGFWHGKRPDRCAGQEGTMTK